MTAFDSNFKFSVKSPEFIQNPYPIYQHLRIHDPVHLSEEGYVFLTRHQDVKAALTDLRLKNAPAPYSPLNIRNREQSLAADVASRLIAFMDPPQHAIPRKMISNAFQSQISKCQPLIEDIAKRSVENLHEHKTCEFSETFSIPFSANCIAMICGIDASLSSNLNSWSDMFFYLFHSIPDQDTFDKINSSIKEFREVIKFELGERKHNPRDDLLSKLSTAEFNNQKLDDDQIIDNLMLIISDAIGNVHAGLTTAVSLILRHEDQRRKLEEQPELIQSAIQECIRFESPAQYQGRIAGETFEIDGKRIRKNQVVLMSLGSASRDPNFVSDPDSFDIERKSLQNIAFGLGIHRCIGFPLVAIEFAAAISALFNGNISLTLKEQKIEWILRAGHRWPQSLTIEVQ